jgi:hypothetical protein
VSFNQLVSLFDGQGLVFWAAVAAVTLGLTMLSVSIFFQIRKLLGKSGIHLRRPRRARQSETVAPANRITLTDEGYKVDHFVPPATTATGTGTGNAAPAASDPLLIHLRDRLKKSADRLDRIHASLVVGAPRNRNSTDSGLKATDDEVDYVYKTARA